MAKTWMCVLLAGDSSRIMAFDLESKMNCMPHESELPCPDDHVCFCFDCPFSFSLSFLPPFSSHVSSSSFSSPFTPTLAPLPKVLLVSSTLYSPLPFFSFYNSSLHVSLSYSLYRSLHLSLGLCFSHLSCPCSHCFTSYLFLVLDRVLVSCSSRVPPLCVISSLFFDPVTWVTVTVSCCACPVLLLLFRYLTHGIQDVGVSRPSVPVVVIKHEWNHCFSASSLWTTSVDRRA